MTAALTALTGCGTSYAGPNCASIRLTTPVSSLPVLSSSPAPSTVFGWSDPLILASPEVACCRAAFAIDGGTVSCDGGGSVDCGALRAQVTVMPLGGKYQGELCNNGGGSSCTLLVVDGGIVGVSAFCFD